MLGNVLSDKFSFKILGIGVISALAFLVLGLLLDSLEANQNVRH